MWDTLYITTTTLLQPSISRTVVNAMACSVRRPREAALDAQFMKQVSQLASLNIRSTHASLQEFKPQEFAAKVVS